MKWQGRPETGDQAGVSALSGSPAGTGPRPPDCFRKMTWRQFRGMTRDEGNPAASGIDGPFSATCYLIGEVDGNQIHL